MSDYSLQLVSESTQGKKRTTTISHVNPTATPATLVEFSQRLNLLTLNTYGQTDLVVKTNLDTETPPSDDRETPTITLNATLSAATINSNSGQTFLANYTGDGFWYPYYKPTNLTDRRGCTIDTYFTNAGERRIVLKSSDAGGSVYAGDSIIFTAEGTDNYKPVTVEVAIQA